MVRCSPSAALRCFSPTSAAVSAVVASLRDIDVKSKGVGANLGNADLMKEMLAKIFS